MREAATHHAWRIVSRTNVGLYVVCFSMLCPKCGVLSNYHLPLSESKFVGELFRPPDLWYPRTVLDESSDPPVEVRMDIDCSKTLAMKVMRS